MSQYYTHAWTGQAHALSFRFQDVTYRAHRANAIIPRASWLPHTPFASLPLAPVTEFLFTQPWQCVFFFSSSSLSPALTRVFRVARIQLTPPPACTMRLCRPRHARACSTFCLAALFTRVTNLSSEKLNGQELANSPASTCTPPVLLVT